MLKLELTSLRILLMCRNTAFPVLLKNHSTYFFPRPRKVDIHTYSPVPVSCKMESKKKNIKKKALT